MDIIRLQPGELASAREELRAALDAADGDSNDTEIELLQRVATTLESFLDRAEAQ